MSRCVLGSYWEGSLVKHVWKKHPLCVPSIVRLISVLQICKYLQEENWQDVQQALPSLFDHKTPFLW